MDLTNNFSLLGSTRTFTNRTKDIFSTLDPIEASHKEFLNDSSNLEGSVNFMKEDPDDNTDHMVSNLGINKNLISTFKQPRPNMRPIKNNLKRLENKKSSSKWSHFSLADVPVVTERSNRQAAEDLLQLYNSKCESSKIEESIEDTFSSKHIFKKPTKVHNSLRKNNTKQQNKLSWNYDFEEEDYDETSSLMDSAINDTILPIKKQNNKAHSTKYENKSLRCSKNDDDYEDTQVHNISLDSQITISLSDKNHGNGINNELKLDHSLNDSDSEDDFTDALELSDDNLEDVNINL